MSSNDLLEILKSLGAETRSSVLLEILKITQMLQSYVLARLKRVSSSGEQGSLQNSPGEGDRSQRLPDSPSSWFSLSGEQGSLKNSSEGGDMALKKIRDKASSLRKGGRDQVSGETSLKNSLGEGTAFETRPHPCKQGDVTKSQGSRASSRTLRGRGTEPETPWSQLLGVSSSGEQGSLHNSRRGVDSES